MSPVFSVDLISDLNLNSEDDLNWEGKPTSLFCVVAGNVSDDIDVVERTLHHLGEQYRGVFYIDGGLEHQDICDYHSNVDIFHQMCKAIPNVIYLHDNVVILNNVALMGCNGWYENNPNISEMNDIARIENYRIEDLGYMSNTIKSLQRHHDAKRIMVVTGSVPCEYLMYQKTEIDHRKNVEPALSLLMDTEHKVENWLFGSSVLSTDINYEGRRYVNNPRVPGQPYWPKRIEL